VSLIGSLKGSGTSESISTSVSNNYNIISGFTGAFVTLRIFECIDARKSLILDHCCDMASSRDRSFLEISIYKVKANGHRPPTP